MKRWIPRIALCLLLGVVTTVGVAWTVGGSMDWRRPVFYLDLTAAIAENRVWWENDARIASFTEGAYWGTLDVADLRRFGNSLGGSTEEEAGEPPFWHMRGRSMKDYSEYAFGWPRLALRGAIYDPIVTTAAGSLLEFEPEGMIVLKRETWTSPGWTLVRPQRFFPLEVIWRGFLINTLFYAILWFGLFVGFSATRRAIRTRRGRCPMCGYDLRYHHFPSGEKGQPPDNMHHPESGGTGGTGGTVGCPECGWGREDGTTNPDLSGSYERRISNRSGAHLRPSPTP